MAKKRPLRSYWLMTRDLGVGYLFLLPLLALYQTGVALDPRARNGAGYLLDRLFFRFGPWGVLVLNFLLLALLCFALARTRRRPLGHPGLYAVMFLEATAWAFVLLATGRIAYAELLSLSPFLRDLVASAGAGVYEEVLFRLVLFGGLGWLLREGLQIPALLSFPTALLGSSMLFSWAHHSIGGDPWNPATFWYRCGMGAALGCIYHLRGLGIAVYAHALYNVFLVLSGALHV